MTDISDLYPATVHHFKDSLAVSHAADKLPLWEAVYRKAWPDFAGMVCHRQDGQHQRDGIDRSVTLVNGVQILIDEKIRKVDYGDILLEYMSNNVYKTAGWVCKTGLRCHYIAYAIEPAEVCYLLPVRELQAAWRENGDQWISQYGVKKAFNPGYHSLNCPVPVDALFTGMTGAMTINWGAE